MRGICKFPFGDGDGFPKTAAFCAKIFPVIRHLALCLLLGCGLPAQLCAQTLDISIRLTEPDQSPVVGATLRLVDNADSSQVQSSSTDTAGMARFRVETGRLYLFRASAMGFKPLEKGIRGTKDKTNFKFAVEADVTALGGVTVSARRPLLRQEEDKTIVDPEPIAAASTNAFEIIEKTPGLFVDQDGNIYLNSATPATVHINGREQRMSAADIANILKNLPPGSIERIEILRSPSAKYDASGSGGIVNVVLKKGIKIGRTGSLNAGMNQGHYGNQYAGFSLNDSEGSRSGTLNLNVNRRDNYDKIGTTRLLGDAQSLRQEAFNRNPGQGIYGGYSLSFEPRPQWELSLDGRSAYNANRPRSTNESIISQRADGAVLTDNINTLRNLGKNFFANQGLRLKRNLDSLGSEWTSDLAYNFARYDGTQDFDIAFLVPNLTEQVGGDGDIATQRHFLTAQTDLRLKYPRKFSLELGLKTALQRFNSSTAYFSMLNGQRSPDDFRTNAFRYDDAIHAAYFQASKTFSAYILKAGLRMENTNMHGVQSVPADTSFRIRRTDLFPYLYFSRRITQIAGFELRGYLIYRRSITRPNYDLLNPFPRFVDQYLYEAGNPALRPEFTHNVEFNVSAGDYPVLAIGRNYVQDLFTYVIYQDPKLPDVAYRTYDNLGKNRETYFRLTGAMPPVGKYFFVLGTQYNLNEYEGLYENQPLRFRRGSWSFFTYHQLRLGSRSTFSLNGFWRVNGQLQFYELSNFGALNMNINRLFFDRKLTVTLSANDVFFTNRNEFRIAQGNITAFGSRQNDSRRVGLNLRYNFGLKKREEQKNMFDLNESGN
jgi:hypothetical protein